MSDVGWWRDTPPTRFLVQRHELPLTNMLWPSSKLVSGMKLCSFGARFSRWSTCHGLRPQCSTCRGYRPCTRWSVHRPTAPDACQDAVALYSPSSGHGAKGGSLWPMGWRPVMPGRHWSPPMCSWIQCWWKPTAVDGSWPTSSLLCGALCWTGLLRPLVVPLWRRYAAHGVGGSWAPPYGQTLVTQHLQDVQMAESTPIEPHTDRWPDGWRLWQEGARVTCPFLARCVEGSHATCASAVDEASARIAIWKPQTSSAARSLRPTGTGGLPCQLWVLGCWTLIGMALFPSLVGALGAHKGRVTACADEEASSSKPPAWQAIDAMQRIENARAVAWRQKHGLVNDEDFAFAFTNYEQAAVTAGTIVANLWVAVRSAASDSMLKAVSEAIVDLDTKAPSTVRPLAPKFKPQRRRVRLQPNTSSSPEVVTSRVDELTDVWLQCDVLRPRGRLSVELRASWEESCRRLAQRQVTHAEPITIANVLKTFQEFKAVLLSRERSLPPDDVDVDHFIHHGTTAPVRALNALRWMTKNGELNWPLKHARLPEQASSKKLSSQAPVVLPPML